MFRVAFRIISIFLLTVLFLSHSFGQQYRQPTAEETAGARVLKEQTTRSLRLPSSASWGQIYRAFFDQSRIAICEGLRSKGMTASCDWETIQIILIAANDPEIKSQTSRDAIVTLTAAKIITLKASFASDCPLLSIQSPWEELLTCSMHKSDDDRRKQLNFAPGTAVEIIDYVWKKEKGRSSDMTPGNIPSLSPHMPEQKT